MECIFIKYDICFSALRKGDNNFHVMCNLYAKVLSSNICKKNSYWNKLIIFSEQKKIIHLSKNLSVSFISMHPKMLSTKYLECYQSLAFNSSLF